ncbi:hypothetical protein IH781_01830 [Patescibacteria group bacterium]|nr:hypothetical protein [Patescibacteria group bacterium]
MSTIERVLFAWLIVLLISSGIWSTVSYIGRNTELIAQSGGVYFEAAVGQPRHINPILAGANDLDVDIAALVYSSLFQLDENLELQKDLATEYSLSEDNLEYTIELRRDVHWHDGEPLTAADVIFTIRSIQTPDYASPLATAFQGVTIEQMDDYTVKFILKQPYAPFLTSLTVGIAPQHVWESIAPKNAALAEQMLKPVGSGPFRFSEIKTRRRTGDVTEFRLVRNKAYYGQRPYLDEIVFSFFDTHDDAVRAFTSGNVDGVGFLPLQLLADVENRRSLVTHRLLLPQYFGLFFNQQNNSALDDEGVRNALAQATDRTAIVAEALGGQGEELHLPIPPGVFAFNNELELPSYDPEAARQNLEEAGWQDTDGDGIREKDGTALRFTITTTDWPEYIRTAEAIQRQWTAIGVDAQIEHVGAGTIQQSIIRPRDYDILLFGQILSAQPDPYPFWHSTQTRSPGLNFALFKNQEVDKLLEEARKTIDIEKRRELYGDFQGYILDLKPALILYRPYYLFAATKDIRGITAQYAARTADRFNDIEKWHKNVKRVWKSK